MKIGCATELRTRLRELRCGSPDALELLGSFETARPQADESALHERFAAERLHGEWFEPTRGLLAYIAERTGWENDAGADLSGRLQVLRRRVTALETAEVPEYTAEEVERRMVEAFGA